MECGVSSNRKNSNSTALSTSYPMSLARLSTRRSVGIGGVPAGHADVVIQLIVAVPAQHHVAKPVTLLERREEFFAAHVFAAHDAIDVEHADLDVVESLLANVVRQVLGGLDVEISHENLSNVFRQTRNPRQNSGGRRAAVLPGARSMKVRLRRQPSRRPRSRPDAWRSCRRSAGPGNGV